MKRSPKLELTGRIEAVRIFLKERSSQEEIVLEIISRFGVSRRQAYRYMEEARKIKCTKPFPEQKVVFTVKLPHSLALLIRHVANSSGESLSSLVTQALRAFLKRRGYGREVS